MEEADRLGGDQRGLLGRLGQDRVAGSERRRDLARRRSPAGSSRERCRPPGPSGRWSAVVELGLGAGGVVAAEIDRLPNLGHGVGDRLAGFAHGEADERADVRLEKVGGALEAGGTLGDPGRGPCLGGGFGRSQGPGHLVGAGLANEPDDVPVVGGVANRRLGASARLVRSQDRRGGPRRLRRLGQPLLEPAQVPLAGEVEPPRVAALGTVEIRRQRDAIGGAAAQVPGLRHLVGHQLVDGDGRIDQAVDEGGVGPVLQEAADQVGQQRLVGADRGVDAAGPVHPVLAHHLVVEGLAHAVQALELPVQAPPHLVDRRQRVRVVRGELGVDRVRRGQHPPGAGEVRHVRVDLARVDGIAVQAALLGALDLAVPIGALDEPAP